MCCSKLALVQTSDTNLVIPVVSYRGNYNSCQNWSRKNKHGAGLNRNSQNLVRLPLVGKSQIENKLKVGLLNSQSVSSKTTDIYECITENGFDIFIITETWLREKGDEPTIIDMIPPGFSFINSPRKTGRGGGIAVIYRSNFKLQRISEKTMMSSFECLALSLTVNRKTTKILCIYRPPPSTKNKIKKSSFYHEFETMVTELMAASEYFIILGDFNVHYDNKEESETRNFMQLLDTAKLIQLVNTHTHRKGHILDWLVTRRETAHHIMSVTVMDKLISDHFLLSFTLNMVKPIYKSKVVMVRNLKDIDMVTFRNELNASKLFTDPPSDVEEFAELYNETLSSLVDKHAPEKPMRIKDRPHAAWQNIEIIEARKEKRQTERKWRKSGLIVDREMFKKARNKFNNLVKSIKAKATETALMNASSDPRKLYSIIDKLCGTRSITRPLPSLDEKAAANTLSLFFSNKTQKIRENFSENDYPKLQKESSSSKDTPSLLFFTTISEENLKGIIKKSKQTYSTVDPVSTKIVIENLDILLPVILKIINFSLKTGIVPKCFKTAAIKPILKKNGLNENLPENYRPVSNLPYLSKLLERAVSDQLMTHLRINNLFDEFQSAYRPGHSTETAILRVVNDILCNINNGKLTLLMLLDLSSAFDTIDHELLLVRLKRDYSISATSLTWFDSYLSDRNQYVIVGTSSSPPMKLTCGVPQGSVLGPILFALYIKELGSVIDKFSIRRQHFADDSQLYHSFMPDENSVYAGVKNIEECCKEIKVWMNKNCLKLNDEKTEAILCGPPVLLKNASINKIKVCDIDINLSTTVRNLGVIIDNNLDLSFHLRQITKSCYYHIRILGKLRPKLTRQAANMLAVSLINSRLDYCNSILWGLPDKHIQKLQKIQNTAARIVSRKKLSVHITEILKQLHWLPVRKRIKHKILSLTYNCLHGDAPAYLKDLVISYVPVKNLRSSSKMRLSVPGYGGDTTKKRSGARSFKNAAPTEWNDLPVSFKLSTNLDSFKKILKTHLFNSS